MTTPDERTQPPDVDRLARSMLLLHGAHDDEHPAGNGGHGGSSRKAPDFAADPQRAAAVREATARDRERYLTRAWHTSTAGSVTSRSPSRSSDPDTRRCSGIRRPRSGVRRSPRCGSLAVPSSTTDQ
jgi:hypothetical protein